MNGDSFLAKLRRLKECLGVADDKEIAAALGISGPALSGRKKRDSFPEEKVFVLAAHRPELRLDTVYVLTGDRSVVGKTRQRLEEQSRWVGSMQPADGEASELLGKLATVKMEHIVRVRQRREEQYDQLLDAMDRMTDSSAAAFLQIAKRVAAADVEDEYRAIREERRHRDVEAQPVAEPQDADSAFVMADEAHITTRRGAGKVAGTRELLKQLGESAVMVTATPKRPATGQTALPPSGRKRTSKAG